MAARRIGKTELKPQHQSIQVDRFSEACLTCPVFVTTAEFLPQHRRQLQQARALIEHADQRGHQRVAEMNRTVEKNLLAIISGLPTCSTNNGGTSSSSS